MTTWYKQNGQEITINDRPETIEMAKSLGWTETKPKQEVKPKPKLKAVKDDNGN